jgi:hypothetical protein
LLPLSCAVNILLVLVDASVGYHLAPLLFRAGGGEPETAESGVGNVRKLLTGVVAALYVFQLLWHFSGYNGPLLLLVTALVLLDLGGQLYVRHRIQTIMLMLQDQS